MSFITKEVAKKVLEAGLSTGATFCEVYLEHTVDNKYVMSKEGVSTVETNVTHGASVRILNGVSEVFGYINDFCEESLVELAKKLASGINNPVKTEVCEFKEAEERKVRQKEGRRGVSGLNHR